VNQSATVFLKLLQLVAAPGLSGRLKALSLSNGLRRVRDDKANHTTTEVRFSPDMGEHSEINRPAG